MNYVYAAIWFAIGLMLIIRLGREGKRFYFAGGVFLLLGAWWLLTALFPNHPFFHGWMGWVFKIVLGISLVALCLIFLRQKKQSDPPDDRSLEASEEELEKDQPPERSDPPPKE